MASTRFLRRCVSGLTVLFRSVSQRLQSRSAAVAATALCCAIGLAPAGAAAEAAPRAFDLPGGDASATLPQFARHSGSQIVYLVENVRGQITSPVRGEFTVLEALRRMLAPTALVAVQDDATGAIAVSRRRSASMAGLPGGDSPAPDQPRAPPAAPPPSNASSLESPTKQIPSRSVKSRTFLALVASWFFATTAVDAQTTGTIEGRVFNATNGAALANARVSLESPARDIVTDDAGAYRLTGVPAGPARILVSYVGFRSEAASLLVPADGTVAREFELELAQADGSVVKLEAFNVVADREMSAQAVAMNEQRQAPNLKNVVAIDEFGDRGTENIGDFLRFIPGVSINDAGLVPNDVILRGFPSAYSGIMVDGGEFASSRGTSRSVSLLEVPMSNISRVEVTKVPTPDQPASGLGGTINLISRSGFESKKATFTGQVYGLFNSLSGVRLDGGPRGPLPTVSPDTIEPSFNFSYLHPVNRNLAFTVGAARTWRQQPADALDEVATWDFVNRYQRQTLWQSVAQVLITTSGQFGVDWRISPQDVLSASFQYRDARNFVARNSLTVAYGTGATGGPTHTQGAATGVGTLTQGSAINQAIGTETLHLNLKYAHRGPVWRLDGGATWSHSRSANEDIDRGYFASTPSSISSVVVRGDGLGDDGAFIPTRFSATTRTGTAVDPYDGRNYSIVTATSGQTRNRTTKGAGRVDAARDFGGRVPFTLKAGVSVDRLERDLRALPQTWNFRPNGLTDATSRLAGRYDVFDEAYNATAPTLYGRPMGWINSAKLYQLYRQQPTWFVLNEPLAHEGLVAGSRELVETTTATYLRADTRLLQHRLWLVGGVRFERTENEGRGALDDPSAQYQKDAEGNLVRNAAGQPILLTTDTLARARLRYTERGARGGRTHRDFYPSLNAAYSLTENLLLRTAYARTVGRPPLDVVIPGATFSDPTALNPTISVSNPDIKPWTADNFDLAIESYHVKDGFGSLGVFQKNISNFFGTSSTPATRELLAYYGLPDDEVYLDYDIRTTANVGTARVTGLEFFYRQSLTFLPHWARGLQIFGNATKLRLEGDRAADFTGFNPLSYSGGLNLIRSRWFLKLSCTHQDEARRTLVAASTTTGVPQDTYNYQGETTRWTLSGQFSLTKNLSLYGTVTDLGGFELVTRRYAPDTPDYARNQRRQVLGSTITLGLKGQF